MAKNKNKKNKPKPATSTSFRVKGSLLSAFTAIATIVAMVKSVGRPLKLRK